MACACMNVSIPSWYNYKATGTARSALLLESFNSFMVQLQAGVVRSVPLTVPCFNSFMVQLQGRLNSDTGDLTKVFQFLHGTITSQVVCHHRYRPYCFNSFMVQLQEFAQSLRK